MKINDAIRFGFLVGRYLLGRETMQEATELKEIIGIDDFNTNIFKKLKSKRNIATEIERYDIFDQNNAWREYSGRLAVITLERSVRRWQIAAAVFIIVGLVSLTSLFKYDLFNNESPQLLYTTFTTPLGQSSKVILPDSSIVWLNSGTSITYNNHFGTDNRDVEVEGQAFFQVEHNEKLPMVVNCQDLNVTVLGTKFDVSAYPNHSNIDVVLEEGKVELSHDRFRSFKHTLRPGEKAEFHLVDHGLTVSSVDIYKYTSWKDGVLIFKNDPMDEVLEKLERWYNIKIEVQDEDIYKMVFNATIVNESVEEIFDLIKYTCSVNYRIIHSKKPEIPEKIILSN